MSATLNAEGLLVERVLTPLVRVDEHRPGASRARGRGPPMRCPGARTPGASRRPATTSRRITPSSFSSWPTTRLVVEEVLDEQVVDELARKLRLERVRRRPTPAAPSCSRSDRPHRAQRRSHAAQQAGCLRRARRRRAAARSSRAAPASDASALGIARQVPAEVEHQVREVVLRLQRELERPERKAELLGQHGEYVSVCHQRTPRHGVR